jgi:hypothetical protein
MAGNPGKTIPSAVLTIRNGAQYAPYTEVAFADSWCVLRAYCSLLTAHCSILEICGITIPANEDVLI